MPGRRAVLGCRGGLGAVGMRRVCRRLRSRCSLSLPRLADWRVGVHLLRVVEARLENWKIRMGERSATRMLRRRMVPALALDLKM